jgi:hypothetical protein
MDNLAVDPAHIPSKTWLRIQRIDHIPRQLIVVRVIAKKRQSINYKGNYKYKDQTQQQPNLCIGSHK